MIKIYHNPRCSKSRLGLSLLEELGVNIEVVKYLNQPLSASELSEILEKLNYKPIELVRKNEKIWKEQFKGKDLTDAQIVQAMVDYPKLIERPIVVNGDKAVVGRPTEKIKEII